MSYQNVTGTLNPGGHPGSYNGQDAYNDMLITGDAHEKDAFMHRGGETAQTLDASYYKGPGARNGKEREIIAEEPIMMSDRKGHNGITDDGTATTLTAQEKERPLVGASVVRRLTPDECASLQGFPRDWCNIGEWTDSKGKVHKDADSPKYKAYGNSIAVGFDNRRSGFWCWMARRICAQYERQITMGSLFSGIGGFELAFASCGAVPVWNSEIEPFPIAVTKKHFGDDDTGERGDFYEGIY